MKTICLYFQVHQPLRLKKYRFFNMGRDHNYLDDHANRAILQKVARKCYLPMNELLLKLIRENGKKFKVSFSISGLAIEQLRIYAPEVLDSFQTLAKTGCVEFLAETYSHSLASLVDEEEFVAQVRRHARTIESEFGVKPKAFRNTELIYSDRIGEIVASMGYRTMLTEGAKHILGWKSPNYVYACASNPKLHLLLRNFKLSDDIAFRFSDRGWAEWPLTTQKYVSWLANPDLPGEVVNLFMDYETFGEHQWAESGIFEFMAHLPGAALATGKLSFATPSEVSRKFQPVGILHCPYPISWADEERDVTAWIGNELQNEAFSKLYRLKNRIDAIDHPDFDHAWNFLQASDHFYYMATKWFSDGDVHSYFNPYDSPYEAFINYMNVLSDFEIEVEKKYAETKREVTA
ncbi:glycoside hydrolase family 57 protein [uncultured Alistipes sp.]|uniref:glycoside hydrolase family 57 protein n=1 Tax=uncultured Alistipes sp. TaxID=538949 RepID=UPI0026232055|nr:glycoside hydrolase family 57 protein [uncultured Alistipes sp.]